MGLQNLISLAGQIVQSLIPLLIAVALVVFFWGLVRYVISGGEDHAQGRNVMIAGLISLFVMVSVWGIIRLAQNTLLNGVNGGSIAPPTVQGLH